MKTIKLKKSLIKCSFMKIKNVKADLHTHGWCGQETGKWQFPLKLLGEREERNLQIIAQRGFEEKQNTLIGFVKMPEYNIE